MISSVLFDLDGTLTDPTEGIVKSMKYALDRLGRPIPDDEKLRSLISASIQTTFVKLLNTNEQPLIEEGIRFFRERYSTIGLFENEVYPGVPELLDRLCQNGYPLFIVTAKAKVFSEKVIEHFKLDKWLNGVFGPSLEERGYTKSRLIESALSIHKLSPKSTAMVGDRREDILAGKSNGTVTVGVTYGSGSREEITGSTPDFICHDPLSIGRALLSR